MNLSEYYIATANEILSSKDKVKNLVPDWGEEEHYKEVFLKNSIRRFLPDTYAIGTGYVVRQAEHSGEHPSSRQIDLIIYDRATPVLFRDDDFVILTPDAVKGIIEVKTSMKKKIIPIVKKANEDGQFIFMGKSEENREQKFFNGVFSYEGYDNLGLYSFKSAYLSSNMLADPNFNKYKVNHVCFNKDWFFKFRGRDAENHSRPHSIYNITNRTIAFFISGLIEMLSDKSEGGDNSIYNTIDKKQHLILEF
ncbi:MAG: hypothetical protein LBT78_05800 [Tannerella sp.]|jgi:hypothetical protein|nr:hypothetical protein [Tannerella sp.]